MAEVLFGQMLRVPRPQFKPIMYATLMVDLCKLRKLFPRGISGCIRCAAAAGACCCRCRRVGGVGSLWRCGCRQLLALVHATRMR